MPVRLNTSMLAALLLQAVAPVLAAGPEPGPPPMAWVDQSQPWDWTKSVVIDPLSRTDVAHQYQTVYLAQDGVAHDWTGNVPGCVAGVTSTAFQDAVIDRVNFFRALAGLPGTITVSSDASVRANSQAAALMMSANGALSHSPPDSWTCYSSGGAGSSGGAASANLALGSHGVDAVRLYMDDPGSFNTAVGHRRWLLHPPRLTMATGDIPTGSRSNALYVFGATGTRPPTPLGVAWPPRGFVPYQLLPSGSNRWSLSYPNAGFAGATIEMRFEGNPIPVTHEPLTSGYGDNTLVWRPATGGGGVVYGASGVDRTYTITISGITNGPTSISYSVTVIDGDETAPDPDHLFSDGFE